MPPIDNDPMDDDDIADAAELARLQAEEVAAKRIALPVKVEPKVSFANERTFLSWLHFTVVL